MLTNTHTGASDADPLTHHARSMVQVANIVHHQIETYQELVLARQPPATPKVEKRRRSRS